MAEPSFLSTLVAFHRAAPDEADAHLDGFALWTTDARRAGLLSPHKRLGLALLASRYPPFLQRGLAALPERPKPDLEAHDVLAALARAGESEALAALPDEWVRPWAQTAVAQQSKGSNSRVLEPVAQALVAGSAENPERACACATWIVTALTREQPDAAAQPRTAYLAWRCMFGHAVQTSTPALLMRFLLTRVGDDGNAAKPWRAAVDALRGGHLEALAGRLEQGNAQNNSPFFSIIARECLQALAFAGADPSWDGSNDEADDAVLLRHRLAQALRQKQPHPALTRMAVALLTRCSEAGAVDAAHLDIVRQRRQWALLTTWAPLAPWLGPDWREAVRTLPTSFSELSALLTSQDTDYARARCAQPLIFADRAPAAPAKLAHVLRNDLRQAVKNGWRPDRGFQPDVAERARRDGWLAHLPSDGGQFGLTQPADRAEWQRLLLAELALAEQAPDNARTRMRL